MAKSKGDGKNNDKGYGGKSVGRGSGLASPLYVIPDPGASLGAHQVEGPRGPVAPPDPMGYAHGTDDHKPLPATNWIRTALNKSTLPKKD